MEGLIKYGSLVFSTSEYYAKSVVKVYSLLCDTGYYVSLEKETQKPFWVLHWGIKNNK